MPGRLFGIATAALLALGLQGCFTAMYLSDRPSGAVLDEMKRRCAEDAGLHWYGPRPEGVDLWLPGQMSRDPADDPQRTSLSPYDVNYEDTSFFDAGMAGALYIQMRPGSGVFGPGRGDPPGIYRFRMLEAGDPGCARWIAYQASRAAPGERPYSRPDGKCVTWDRVEGVDETIKAHTFIRFSDGPAAERGLYRDGQVLIVNGRERARFTAYWAINPRGAAERRSQWGIKACQYADYGILGSASPE
ncbi:hypothetical protein [Brevundimonas goettingensis]|uniref:Lipoprotein n=1 Tax=Brevundimonas goettingensis TaxID=2774190 RepID=A0A975C3B3_9CAUL|nr:hypothetical protein [Brevundimonas goettingensis]QTC93061.1 hypothetical protein IFJ75_09570 [Brevundimonas goettingensis]